MKYWTKARIKRRREREARRERRLFEECIAAYERSRTYSAGETKKNVALMLDALGSPVRRQMIGRLQKDGAMSVSKLARPFRFKLTTALSNVRVLEGAGIIGTHKRGRVRVCAYRKGPLKELAEYLRAKRFRL